MRRLLSLVVLIVLLSALPQGPVGASPKAAAADVVDAVLFYRPDCPHCHYVLTEVFPPLQQQYGDRLVILEIDTTTPQGNALWQAALATYDLSRGNPPQVGVPTLIVDGENLVGSQEIPEQFPALIEKYLAEGGVGWPDLPGIDTAIANLSSGEPAPTQGLWATVGARYTRDLAGNILATLVLIVLLATLVAVIRPRDWQMAWAKRAGSIGLLVVILIGTGAAAYLTYVETTGNSAICGPIGDCNSVQQSEYAFLFGVFPVAVLGLIGYLGILLGHIYVLWIRGPRSELVSVLVFAMALIGLAFSIYLTFLEPFVIGATCAWCLTSAICMIIVNLLTAGPAWRGMQQLGLIKTTR